MPQQSLLSDITVIPTRTDWRYLAALLDVYSRSVIGWSLAEKADRGLLLSNRYNAKHRSYEPVRRLLDRQFRLQMANMAYRIVRTTYP